MELVPPSATRWPCDHTGSDTRGHSGVGESLTASNYINPHLSDSYSNITLSPTSRVLKAWLLGMD